MFERLATDGCIVFDRLFDPALIDRARAEYERQYAAFDEAGLPLHMNVGDRRLHLPIALTGALIDPALYANPLLMMALRGVFGEPFLIDNATVVTALPGAAAQRLHRDHTPLFGEHRGLAAEMPPYAITVSIPLIDLDETTGTTALFPGSIRLNDGADGEAPPLGTSLDPYVKRGGCFLMDYRLWHRGLANVSDRSRPILYLIYAREWFTDVRNFKKHARLLVSEEDAQAIPAEHRPMFRRLAGKGLLDLTIKELKAAPESR
jgi:hypothetical protein